MGDEPFRECEGTGRQRGEGIGLGIERGHENLHDRFTNKAPTSP